ncbi:hypothetical protein DPMN_133058 [Dreissena polymorpha]|uniref:Uncharacterized protein n=1 Tax=Dreissena polymorpha TaxID=45954 RepID=A0A9D4JAM3_DREPO|nr:hypothetical protein DPMN_133058 [Dreissena polymorpha]
MDTQCLHQNQRPIDNTDWKLRALSGYLSAGSRGPETDKYTEDQQTIYSMNQSE